MSSTRKRVVITGLGLVSPIGCDVEAVWDNLSNQQSGIRPIQNIDCRALPFSSGGEVAEFTGSIDDYGPLNKQLQRSIKKNMKVMCREIEMGVAASQKALFHSGLGEDRDPDRCGCLFGCDYILTRPEEFADGLIKCRRLADGKFDVSDWPRHGLHQVNPLWLLKYLPNMPNSHVSIYNDFRGPNNSITDREASMNLALSEATSIIQRGAADVMLVGATGSRLHPLRSLHVSIIEQIAGERDDPASMSRPFDRNSDGMVLGEGAGAVILESLEHAQDRGAKMWGEIVGFGAAHVGAAASPDHLCQAASAAMSQALRSSQGRYPANWHVHAHGMGIPHSDNAEARALNEVLRDLDSVPVTAAKSYFGNLGAGSGAVELICSLLALDRQQLFPIRNLDAPLESIRWQPARPDSAPGQAVMHNSFTQQGQAASLIVALP